MHEAMKIAANNGGKEAVSAVPSATMSTNMKSGNACDDSTKPFRTQRVEGTTRLTKIQPKLDTQDLLQADACGSSHLHELRRSHPKACRR